MNVLIIDDHPIVRDAVRRLVVDMYPHARVRESTSAREAMREVPRCVWDIVFLDIDLPDRSGLDLLRDLRDLAPGAPVLVLSGTPEEVAGERALRAGAAGFIEKGVPGEEIQAAIRRVRAGKKYISADLAVALVEQKLHPRPGEPHEVLSEREREGLRRIGEGRSAAELAGRLHLSVQTA